MTTRTLALLALALCLASAPAASAADFRAPAAEAYRSGRFDPGIRALRAELNRMGRAPSPARAEALYLLGRLELRKAELMTEVARAAGRHAADHIARLAAGPTPLKRAAFFLGVARMEVGDRAGAAAAFRQALKVIPARASGEDLITRQLAELRLRALQGQPIFEGIVRLSALATAGDPRVAAEAGYLLALSSKDPSKGLALVESALVQSTQAAGVPPAAVVRAAAGVRLAAGQVDEALALLEGDEPHAPASTERAGAHLSVDYYEVAVPRLMAEAYLEAAIRDLGDARETAAHPNLREAATFSMARAQLLAGSPKAASDLMAGLEKPATLGPAGVSRARALVARARAAQKARAEAARLFEQALADAGTDPDALAEIADYVADAHERGEADARLVQVVLGRTGQVADGWPRRLPPQLAAGLAALTRAAGGDAAAEVTQFERGRDKSAKNRLDANDPVVLARLAQAQVRARLFSEALEIYFEMAKAYPEVRQVQEALQGVYAAEQVAGGEVRIN